MASKINYIRNKYNQIIGYVRDDGDKLTGWHYKKGIVGFYMKKSNLTLDGKSRIYAYGDAVASLVYMAENS